MLGKTQHELPLRNLESEEHVYNQLSQPEEAYKIVGEVRKTIYAESQHQYRQYVEPEGVQATKLRSAELKNIHIMRCYKKKASTTLYPKCAITLNQLYEHLAVYSVCS